jgi:hypothetical protein
VAAVLEVAAQNHFPLSLSVQMLNTPSDSMYEISTVGEASRWEIAVGPVLAPPKFNAEFARMVCNNIDGQALDLEPSARAGAVWDISPKALGEGWLELEMPEGWRQEGATGCKVSLNPEALKSNKVDLAGYAEISEFRQYYLYQAFAPQTRIADLARKDDLQGETVPANFGISRNGIYRGKCLVIAGKEVKDIEACTLSRLETLYLDNRERAVDTFQWPSGAKTVVEELTSLDERKFKLNGAETEEESVYLDEYVELHALVTQAIGEKSEENHCWLNPASGNHFCFSEQLRSETVQSTHFSYPVSLFE